MFVQVTGGNSGGVYYDTTRASAGMVRYHNNELQVYDGNSWLSISSSYASVGLTSPAESAINWALGKMNEEQTILQYAKDHPAVAAAYENLKRAEEQLKITMILSKDEETTS